MASQKEYSDHQHLVEFSHNSFHSFNLKALYFLLVVALIIALVFVLLCARRLVCSDTNKIGSFVDDHESKRSSEGFVEETISNSSSSSSSEECCICLGHFEGRSGEKIKVLPNCQHGFHYLCLEKWLRANSTCPLCRNKHNLSI